MGMYKYGFCEWYLPFNGPSTLKFVKEMGYDGIQIGDMGGLDQNFPLTNKRIADEYAESAAKLGIEIQMIDILSVLNDGSLRENPDSECGSNSVLAMKKAFEAAQLMGVKNVFIPSVLSTRIQNRYHLKNTIENLRRGKEIADDMGIEFLYESFSGINETKKICSEAGGIRLVYDTLNLLKYGFGERSEEEIIAYGTEMIHTVHFKDINESFTSDVPFGTGIGRVKESAAALKTIGYEGWIVNENTYFKTDLQRAYFSKTIAADYSDPWEIGANDLETLKHLFE